MKKTLLVLFVALLAISCDKEDEVSSTTYTFKNSVEYSTSLNVKAILFEYSEAGDKIGNNTLDIKSNPSKHFIANENAKKVKVYLELSYGGYNEVFWVQQVYYLDKGKDTVIELKDDTLTGKNEP